MSDTWVVFCVLAQGRIIPLFGTEKRRLGAQTVSEASCRSFFSKLGLCGNDSHHKLWPHHPYCLLALRTI